MKSKSILVLLLLLFTIVATAQDLAGEASVEKSVYGIHTGLIGVWLNAEFKLAPQIALRTEIGTELGTISYEYSKEPAYLLIPVFSVEPRWYYNLDKRVRKGKSIAKNSGNAFSINFKYSPNQYLTSSEDGVKIPNQLAIVPSWGIRRVYGKHFTFEVGTGVGPLIAFGDDEPGVAEASDYFVDLKVRIGYTF